MPAFPDHHSRLRTDPGAVGASLASFPDQIISAWQQLRPLRLPKTYRHPTAVVVAGMGGSHLGADIARSIYATELRVPVVVVSDYHLPAWVNRQTLVMVMSYSGSTAESLACLREARTCHAHVVAITSGGALAALARRTKTPLFQYEPRENVSRQPRLGVAYSFVATLHTWSLLGLIKMTPDDRKAMTWAARAAVRRFAPTEPAKNNPAKKLATVLHGHIPLFIGAEWTVGNLQTWTNQIHENAKTYAAFDVIPDLDHHLLEGLRDRAVARQIAAVFIHDDGLDPRNTYRLKLTAEIMKKLGTKNSVIKSPGETNLEKAMHLLAFGGYVSWYLSILKNVDPAAIPTVDYLKAHLK